MSRTPSPGLPSKRLRTSFEEIAQDFRQEAASMDYGYDNLSRLQQTPESLGYESVASFHSLFSYKDGSQPIMNGKPKMQTGCIPCL